MRLAGWLVIVSVSFISLGCNSGGGGSSSPNKEESPAAESKGTSTSAPKQVDVSKLPKLGDYFPPQAGGTIEIAAPEEWSLLPKNTKDKSMLMWFYHKEKAELPRLEVKLNDNPFAGISEVTEENLVEFSKKLQAEVKKSRTDKEILEKSVPLMLGDSPWARYVRLAKTKTGLAQIQSLQTIRNDKLIVVDLLIEGTEAADMKKYKDFGYAVAAGMKFKAK